MFGWNKARICALLVAAVLGLSVASAQAARATSQPAPVSFGKLEPAALKTGNCLLRVVGEDSAEAKAGSIELHIVDPSRAAYVILPLPETVSLHRRSKLTAHVRVASAEGPVQMRWFAMDADSGLIFQRRFDLLPGGQAKRMEWPLPLWRWGNDKVGAWSEVRALALRVESNASQIWLDQLVVEADDDADAADEAMVKTAFPDRPVQTVMVDDFLVATDAMDEVPREQMLEIIDHMKRLRSWTRRVFTDAKPVEDSGPIAMFIFRRMEDYSSFFIQLGRQWNVAVVPPSHTGYTVQDICAAVREGPMQIRPVYVHEATHAVVARELRLLVGDASHAWLQEGLANYIQLSLFPQSMSRNQYVKLFHEPIGEGTFFRPLGELLGKPVHSGNYAQLASLLAFLAQERPHWLQQIATGLAQKKELKDILHKLGVTMPELQRQWLEWGRREFAVESDEMVRLFPLPQEWVLPTAPMPGEIAPRPQDRIRPYPQEVAAEPAAN